MKNLLITALLFLSLAAVALGGNTKSKPHNEVFVPPTPEEEAKATKDFTFGDIIEFPYKHKRVVPFKHYGVFVGNHRFQTTGEQQGPHDTLFHFSESEDGMKCQFSTVLAAAEGVKMFRSRHRGLKK
ncbi:hypothetical protein ANANG_G00077000 [Anguilla anguilla]|uniref:Uncharacterized protein n=1 Tax=Anguilla anguilla TaxID=7936 RepID=A0A9D3ML93_ANGAN|nr:hypothetical protein ANANG_G00077000 [Anguilla anguilla]